MSERCKHVEKNGFNCGSYAFNLYKDGILQLDYKSCEMMADDLYAEIAARYPDRAVWIEVAEDGENGALIKYELSRPSLSIKI